MVDSRFTQQSAADVCSGKYSDIKNWEDCSLGARVLFRDHDGPINVIPISESGKPHGCSYKNSDRTMYFNAFAGTGSSAYQSICIDASVQPGYFMRSPGYDVANVQVYYVDETGTEKYPVPEGACAGPGTLCAALPYNICHGIPHIPQVVNDAFEQGDTFTCQMACPGGLIPPPASICTPSSGGSSNVGIIILIVAIVLALLIGIGIWYYVKHKPSKNNIETTGGTSTIET